MKILIVRHAIAEDRDAFAETGEEDGLRPLTKEGKKKMRRVAKGLRALAPNPTLLATSPLTRAVQTGQILAAEYDGLASVQIAQLTPRKPVNALLQWLQTQPMHSTVILVGHEPHVGTFTSWLLTGLQESFLPFKKGGACLLELSDEIKPGRAKMHWFLKPGQLRALG